jgi:hypothetical protein
MSASREDLLLEVVGAVVNGDAVGTEGDSEIGTVSSNTAFVELECSSTCNETPSIVAFVLFVMHKIDVNVSPNEIVPKLEGRERKGDNAVKSATVRGLNVDSGYG